MSLLLLADSARSAMCCHEKAASVFFFSSSDRPAWLGISVFGAPVVVLATRKEWALLPPRCACLSCRVHGTVEAFFRPVVGFVLLALAFDGNGRMGRAEYAAAATPKRP